MILLGGMWVTPLTNLHGLDLSLEMARDVHYQVVNTWKGTIIITNSGSRVIDNRTLFHSVVSAGILFAQPIPALLD